MLIIHLRDEARSNTAVASRTRLNMDNFGRVTLQYAGHAPQHLAGLGLPQAVLPYITGFEFWMPGQVPAAAVRVGGANSVEYRIGLDGLTAATALADGGGAGPAYAELIKRVNLLLGHIASVAPKERPEGNH
jgi:hypothetical protein